LLKTLSIDLNSTLPTPSDWSPGRQTCPKTRRGGSRRRAGDVLLSITADLGRSSVVTSDIEGGYVNQHLAILRLNKYELNSRYLSAYLSSDAGVRQFFVKNKSAVKAGINFSDIRSLEIQVPPISLQRSYENLYERVMGFQLRQAENLDVAEAAFSSLSQKAFRGEL
jgi:type I restriction enzyme, S subunit